MAMQDLNDLAYFVQVVDHGGFAAAGRALGTPKSKLSRRIALLEQRLGVRLIQRSTRRFSVTDVGQTFYAHCKAMLVEAEAATEAVELSRTEPRGVVRFSCPVALLQARVGAMVADFLTQCPRVTIDVQALDRPVDVIAEGYDFEIRARQPPLPDSGLILRNLATGTQCLVASPALLARLGTPAVPADLGRFPSLDPGPAAQEHLWQLEGPGGAQASIRHQPRLITGDMVTLRRAALAGVGVTHLPTMIIAEEIRSGALVRLLPDWAPPSHLIHAVLPSKRFVLPSVRALVDFLVERFRQLDAGQADRSGYDKDPDRGE